MAGADFTEHYKATTFRVETPAGHIDIRVGAKHPGIDSFLSRHNATEWAYITAWNPASQPLSADQNELANVTLLQSIRNRGFEWYVGDGIPDNKGWTPGAVFGFRASRGQRRSRWVCDLVRIRSLWE